MIMLALLAMLQVAPPTENDEIVIIGRRLHQVSVTAGRDSRGRMSCSLSQSTGNARLDRSLCKTAAKCVSRGAVTPEAVGRCVTAKKPALLDDIRRSLRSRSL